MWAKRYQLNAVIGRGAGTTVYRATRLSDRASLAVKVLDLEDPAPRVLARFRDEARILRSLRDVPTFVRAEPPVRLGGRWVVLTELVPGNTAFSLLRHGPFPAAAAATVVSEVASALAAAWEHPGPHGPIRLVHRDLKPGNLQITLEGRVRILDLGIASAALPDREAGTGGIVLGTLGYHAPERVRGGESAPAGDVYALGVVLRVLVTGVQPSRVSGFSRPAADEHALLALAGEMQAMEPSERPTMSDAATRAAALASSLPGPDLAAWASQCVRPVEGTDARCGQVWAEDAWIARLATWLRLRP